MKHTKIIATIGPVTESEEQLFNFTGENSNGIIGYCPEVQKSFIAFSTPKQRIKINCK